MWWIDPTRERRRPLYLTIHVRADFRAGGSFLICSLGMVRSALLPEVPSGYMYPCRIRLSGVFGILEPVRMQLALKYIIREEKWVDWTACRLTGRQALHACRSPGSNNPTMHAQMYGIYYSTLLSFLRPEIPLLWSGNADHHRCKSPSGYYREWSENTRRVRPYVTALGHRSPGKPKEGVSARR